MATEIYFDRAALRRKDFYRLNSEIRTEDGKRYELEDWIGRGGNAAVFRARQRITDEECAIKFLMATGTNNARRFQREIRLLKAIHGDHIIVYHGTGQAEVKHNKHRNDTRLPFVVMELADGDLRDLTSKQNGPMSYETYAGQFRGLAEALAVLHCHAVHRDIKPENILVVGERWLLSDYGLCTFVNPDEEDLTGERRNIGPKYWLSPEAHNRRLGCGDEINAASDVFQLAAIFWYVATGRQPVGIVTEDDWTGPKKLYQLLHRSLLHDCTQRPQNGVEFYNDLVDALVQ